MDTASIPITPAITITAASIIRHSSTISPPDIYICVLNPDFSLSMNHLCSIHLNPWNIKIYGQAGSNSRLVPVSKAESGKFLHVFCDIGFINYLPAQQGLNTIL